MNTRKHIVLALAMITMAMFVQSCGDSSESDAAGGDQTPVQGEWAVVHQLSDPEGLNPLITNDASASAMFSRVFEKLLEQDYETTDLYPVLVESRPVISDDHLTYTFKLRKGITFSDGKPLTSKDVVFTYKVVKNPLITDGAALRNYYESINSVTASDDQTIIVTLKEPYFLAEFFLGGIWIIPKHLLDPKNLTDRYSFDETNDITKAQANAALREFADWYNTPEVKLDVAYNVGSGPYIFEDWKRGETITLKRNPKYWNKGNDKWNPSYLEKIVYKVVKDRSTAVVSLKNGEMDFMEYVPPSKYVDEVDTMATPFLRKVPFSTQIYSYLGFNMDRPTLSDVNVRRAIAHCVDRKAIIKQSVRGLAELVNSPIYRERPEYDKELPEIPYDPSKARQMLAMAGWSDTDGDGVLDKTLGGKRIPLQFTFLYNAGNELREAVALTLSEELRKIGVKMEIRKIEWSVFLENLRTRNFDMYMGSWVNDPIPSDPYQIWHSSQIGNKGSNYVGFRNSRADQLMEMNRTEFDESKRIAYMKEFQRIVATEQPYVFLWSPQYPSVYNSRLQNVKYSYVRPGYMPTQWWIPKSQWKYTQSTN